MTTKFNGVLKSVLKSESPVEARGLFSAVHCWQKSLALVKRFKIKFPVLLRD